MQILGYFILAFGVVGIGLGAYGLFMPSARRRGFALSLPRLKMPGKGGGEDVDQLIAELEQSGFRNSPFESKTPAPTIVKPSGAQPLRGPGTAAKPRPVAAKRAVPLPALDDDEDEISSVSLRGYDDDEEEELDPVVAELLAEVQAAQEAAAQEAAEREAALGEDADELFAEEEGAEEAPSEEPAAEADLLSDDMSNLFAETTVISKTSEALRDAIPAVTIEDLLAQAREMRTLFSEPPRGNRVA